MRRITGVRQIGTGLGELLFVQLDRSGDFSALSFQRRNGSDFRHGGFVLISARPSLRVHDKAPEAPVAVPIGRGFFFFQIGNVS
jgi:hypothetical protein